MLSEPMEQRRIPENMVSNIDGIESDKTRFDSTSTAENSNEHRSIYRKFPGLTPNGMNQKSHKRYKRKLFDSIRIYIMTVLLFRSV